MFRGARRALHFAGVNLIAFLRSIPGYFATWPMQELTGTTALADNVALALGRVLNGITYADYTPDGPEWSDLGSDVAHCDGTQAVGTNLVSNPLLQLAIGKTYTIAFPIANIGGGSLRFVVAGVAGTVRSTNGTHTQNITATSLSGFVLVASDDFIGDIDLKLVKVQQTGILDSGAGFGLLDGTYVGVSLAQPGAGNIEYFVKFGGAADYLTVLSAENNSALNPLSFEIVIFGNDFTWDANVRTILNYYVDASNYIRIDKTAVAGQLAVYYQEQGQALDTVLIATGSPAGLFSVGIGVESNVFQATYNGVQSGANQALTGSFVGNFTIMTIGALNTTPTNVTLGSLAYPVEFTTQLSAATRLQIKSAFGVS